VTQEVEEAVHRLRAVLGPRADALWALYLASDRDGRQSLEAQIRLLDLRMNRMTPGGGPGPLPPPEAGLLDGWLRLGDVVFPNLVPSPFGLERGELIQHVGIFGRSGSGKTNTVMGLLRGLLERDVPFLIFDWKRNYRDLLAAPWVPEGKVVAVTAGRDLSPLRWNPLRPPPGTGARTWLKKLIEIVAHAYFLGEGVMYLLQEAIDRCYQKAGVYEGGDRYQTFHDVHAELRKQKVTGREANWMASTLRALGSLTYGPMAETVCHGQGADVGELLQRNVILELDALTDSDKAFLVEALLLYIHHLRLTEPERETLKHVLVVEEAHHVFLRSKQEVSGGEPITDVILREIRELGEAVVLVDQHPSQIAITALGNTFCTIAMNLKHRADVTTIADACLLEPDQRDHLGRLPVGHAVVKLQDRWMSPFQVRFPKVQIAKGVVTDAVLQDRRAAFASRAGNPEIPGPEPPIREVPPVPLEPKETTPPELAGELRLFLEDVAAHPGAGVTDRYRRLGLSRRKGTVLKKQLVEAGLVRGVDVPLPGGRVTLLELSNDGLAVLGQPTASPRHGGVVHKFWVERIAQALRSGGYAVNFETAIGGGQAVDLVAINGNMSVAVEVEVSGRRLDASLEKLGRAAGARAILACADNVVADRARQRVKADPGLAGIEVVHVWSLV